MFCGMWLHWSHGCSRTHGPKDREALTICDFEATLRCGEAFAKVPQGVKGFVQVMPHQGGA